MWLHMKSKRVSQLSLTLNILFVHLLRRVHSHNVKRRTVLITQVVEFSLSEVETAIRSFYSKERSLFFLVYR